MTLVGERKACAAAVMAFFATIFFLNGVAGPPPLMPMMLALAIAYLTAFVGIVAGYFWARWYSMGIAFSGLIIAGMIWWQIGFEPVVLVFGGTHGLAALALTGRALCSVYDGRKEWRERWKLDDNAANRLGKAIMRAGASLPYLIMAGLAPRQGNGMLGDALLLLAAALGVSGLYGLVKLRTWGVFAMAGASLLVIFGGSTVIFGGSTAPLALWSVPPLEVLPAASLLAIAAVLPFAKPIFSALRAR